MGFREVRPLLAFLSVIKYTDALGGRLRFLLGFGVVDTHLGVCLCVHVPVCPHAVPRRCRAAAEQWAAASADSAFPSDHRTSCARWC